MGISNNNSEFRSNLSDIIFCIFTVANLNPIKEQSQEDSLPPANQMELEPEPELPNGNAHQFIENLHVRLQ